MSFDKNPYAGVHRNRNLEKAIRFNQKTFEDTLKNPTIIKSHDPTKTIKCKCGGDLQFSHNQWTEGEKDDILITVDAEIRCQECSQIYGYDRFSYKTQDTKCSETSEQHIRALAKRVARLERLAHEHKTMMELLHTNRKDE